MNVSWFQTKNICASYNATLLRFSGYDDVLTVQAFLWEILHEALPKPIFPGLKKEFKVSFSRDLLLYYFIGLKLVWGNF